MNDPDVADAYLRVSFDNGKFQIRALYLEESNADPMAGKNDVPLLNLMTDINDSVGNEKWIPNDQAICALAENFSEIIELEINPN